MSLPSEGEDEDQSPRDFPWNIGGLLEDELRISWKMFLVHCFNGLLQGGEIETLAAYCEDEVKLTGFFRVINRIRGPTKWMVYY